MTLAQIIIFIALSGVHALLSFRFRPWLLFIVSILAIYALQPTLNIRWLDYSLPTATLFITTACWYLTSPHLVRENRWFARSEDDTESASFQREDIITL